jgi:phosphatidate cytidylyltransferase
MLRYRLLFGTLMTVFFTAVVILDSWLDGSLTASATDDRAVQATILCVVVAAIITKSQFEFSRLAAARNLKIFMPVSGIASILFAGTWYWMQFIAISPHIYLVFLCSFSLAGLFLYQYLWYGTSGVIANCGANYFSIIYLGLLSSFALAIRIDFGLWPLLMFVFTVKCADIGAYAVGSLLGKHKFSPKISRAKTWEGMAGAIVTGIVVAVLFAKCCGIMNLWLAAVFGFCAAVIGQCGDLVESMMKRDAEQKDSADNVPGFGGVLDIIDSPLLAAPFAYLFLMFAIRVPVPH